MEVIAQTGVVLLDDHPGRLLHCLGPDAPLKAVTTQSHSEYRYSNTLGVRVCEGAGPSNSKRNSRKLYQNEVTCFKHVVAAIAATDANSVTTATHCTEVKARKLELTVYIALGHVQLSDPVRWSPWW